MKKTTLIIVTVLIASLLTAGVTAYVLYIVNNKAKNIHDTINSFEECKAKGYQIMESYPEQCRTPDGKTFTRAIPGETMSVTGEVVCLPHKDTTGPQTLECAFGIRDQNGTHYALSDPEMKYVIGLPTGKFTTVTGTFKNTEDESLNKYDTVGTLVITDIAE